MYGPPIQQPFFVFGSLPHPTTFLIVASWCVHFGVVQQNIFSAKAAWMLHERVKRKKTIKVDRERKYVSTHDDSYLFVILCCC